MIGKPFMLTQKAARFVIPALLNEAQRLLDKADIQMDEDAIADYTMDAAFMRAIAAGLADDLAKASSQPVEE